MAIDSSALFDSTLPSPRLRRFARASLGFLGGSLTRFAARLALAEQVADERRQLARLDDSLLRDIGIDRACAHRESGRRFWDLPTDRDC
ncbi:MAG: DUF1127 domain-containing protein [Burkholderiaceae bacterium]